MTGYIKTISHGTISCGYTTYLIGMITLGKYAFTTKYFCEFIQYLADNSDFREGSILAYGLDKLKSESDKDLKRFLKRTNEFLKQNYENKFRKTFIDREIGKSQEKLLSSDKLDPEYRLTPLDVRISEDNKTITIGEYVISALEFIPMAVYVTEGGFKGWSVKQPEFAKTTIEKMRESKSPLIIECKKWYLKKKGSVNDK